MVWPEQEQYERLRPIVLFGETAARRAKEIGVSERTLHNQAKRFEQLGMISLFHKTSRIAQRDMRFTQRVPFAHGLRNEFISLINTEKDLLTSLFLCLILTL